MRTRRECSQKVLKTPANTQQFDRTLGLDLRLKTNKQANKQTKAPSCELAVFYLPTRGYCRSSPEISSGGKHHRTRRTKEKTRRMTLVVNAPPQGGRSSPPSPPRRLRLRVPPREETGARRQGGGGGAERRKDRGGGLNPRASTSARCQERQMLSLVWRRRPHACTRRRRQAPIRSHSPHRLFLRRPI